MTSFPSRAKLTEKVEAHLAAIVEAGEKGKAKAADKAFGELVKDLEVPGNDAPRVLRTRQYQVFDEWWGPLEQGDNLARVLGRLAAEGSIRLSLSPLAPPSR